MRHRVLSPVLVSSAVLGEGRGAFALAFQKDSRKKKEQADGLGRCARVAKRSQCSVPSKSNGDGLDDRSAEQAAQAERNNSNNNGSRRATYYAEGATIGR